MKIAVCFGCDWVLNYFTWCAWILNVQKVMRVQSVQSHWSFGFKGLHNSLSFKAVFYQLLITGSHRSLHICLIHVYWVETKDLFNGLWFLSLNSQWAGCWSLFFQCTKNVNFCQNLVCGSIQVKNNLSFKSVLPLAVILMADNEPEFIQRRL